MTIREAAVKAGVSETVVKRWCADGRVIGSKVGRSWVIDAASLEEYLRQPVTGRGPDKRPRRNARPDVTAVAMAASAQPQDPRGRDTS